MNDVISFGAWHKRRRKALGLTQDSLARLIGCSTVTVKKIESDDLQASVQLTELIATHLQIPRNERADFITWARGGKVAGTLSSHEMPWQSQALTPSLPRRTSDLPAQLTRLIQILGVRELPVYRHTMFEESLAISAAIGDKWVAATSRRRY